MRHSSLYVCAAASFGIAVTVACADSGADGDGAIVDAGADEHEVLDAAASSIDSSVDAAVEIPNCSPAGWCETALPDVDLRVVDVWPFENHTLAVAVSETLGTKVLEWTEADAQWRYIDDTTQNDSEMGAYVGSMWAPSEEELYFTVAPGYVYHGTKAAPPAADWTWTRTALPNVGASKNYGTPIKYPPLGVWGTNSSNVYAWLENTIFHWTRDDAGTQSWVTEYVADDAQPPYERLFFTAAGGPNADDVWFVGSRFTNFAECPLVVRKTTAGYERIADGSLATYACEQNGPLMIGGAEGGLSDLQTAAGKLVALKGGRTPVRFSFDGDGYLAEVATTLPASLGLEDGEKLLSMWADANTAWLSGGFVVHGIDVWSNGTYEISTLARNGAPIVRAFWQVRGSSNTNLWAVGDFHALHKTTL